MKFHAILLGDFTSRICQNNTMIPQKISGNATQRLPPDHPSLNCFTWNLETLPCQWLPNPGFLRDDLLEHSKQRTILTQHCCVRFVSFVCPSMLNECCFILYFSIWVIVVGRKSMAPLQLSTLPLLLFFPQSSRKLYLAIHSALLSQHWFGSFFFLEDGEGC